MKCTHCASEWNVSPQVAATLENCPFCGKPLAQEPRTMETLLKRIFRENGAAAAEDGRKLIEHFERLAPELIRERRLLSYLVECGGHQELFEVRLEGEDRQNQCMEENVRRLVEEFFITENAARQVCEAWRAVVSGMSAEEQPRDQKLAADFKPEMVRNVGMLRPAITVAPGQPAADPQKDAELAEIRKLALSEDRAAEGFRRCMGLAAQGYAPAQNMLAYLYSNAYGTAWDPQKAMTWYTAAAKQGHVQSMSVLADIYQGTFFQEKNEELMLFWYTNAAERGDGQAMYRLGDIYLNRDSAQAIRWLTKAAETGDFWCCYRLGEIYESGIPGYPRDLEKAREWYVRSSQLPASRTSATSWRVDRALKRMNDPSVVTPRLSAEYVSYLDENSAKGMIDAKYEAMISRYTKSLSEKEMERIMAQQISDADQVLIYSVFAEKGCQWAMEGLTGLYSEGIGVYVDLVKSAYWAFRASGLGSTREPKFQSLPALEPEETFRIVERSAQLGSGAGQRQLADCYAKGRGTARDLAKAAQWYQCAADQGDQEATLNLAYLYEHGVPGVPADLRRAYGLYTRLAGQKGNQADLAKRILKYMKVTL